MYDALLLYDSAAHACYFHLIYNMLVGRLARQLEWREEQAYQGANEFYGVGITLAIGLAMFGHLRSWYNSEGDQGKQKEILTALLVYGLGAIASYIVAFKFYKQCNAI